MAVSNIFGRDFYYGTAAEAATTTPRTDGALYWATDTLTLYCYSGAAWNVVGGGGAILINHDHSGDAGDGGTFDAANLTSGASGDGDVLTSDGLGGAAWEAVAAGDVATDAIWDAKGDLAAGTGANTASKLAVGTDGKYLKADSGQATGLIWDVLANHDHSGDAGDGGTFDAANLTAGASTDGQVLTSDGAGGAAWEDPAAASGDVATDTIWDAKGDLAVGTGANTASKLSVGADGTVLTADSGEATGAIWADPAPVRQTILTFVGTLTISDNPLRIYNQMGVTQTISEVFIAVNTAPTGANIIADIHKDGVTIFTNQAHRPEIAAAGYTDSTTDIDIATWADGEYLTAHVDQIGSTIAGADLVIHIIHR